MTLHSATQVVMTHLDNNELVRSVLGLIKPLDHIEMLAVYGPTWIRNSAVIEVHTFVPNPEPVEQLEKLIEELCASGSASWSTVGVTEEVNA